MHLLFKYFSKNYKYCLGLHATTQYENKTFVQILIIYSHYDPYKPLLMGATSFSTSYIYYTVIIFNRGNFMITNRLG